MGGKREKTGKKILLVLKMKHEEVVFRDILFLHPAVCLGARILEGGDTACAAHGWFC